MIQHNVSTMANEQNVLVDLSVGNYVILFETIDFNYQSKDFTGQTLFEGEVEQFVPQTGLLSFTDASEDIGRAKFMQYVSESEGITILEQ